ncbi:MAG: selenium cofactor biosynthesis protein YqeC [Bacillota bacterium]
MSGFKLELTLRAALGLADRELAAFTGGGGKTAALRRLGLELAEAGRTVVAATTTKVYREQFAGLGEVVVSGDYRACLAGLRRALASGRVAAAGREIAWDGKLVGLPAEWVDEFWRTKIADYLLVEADGSRGRSLKAPAEHEPVVPGAATLVVPVVGLDVLGRPLTAEFVHRPEIVARIAKAVPGSPVTPAVAGKVIVHPAGLSKGVPPGARVVPLINKVDGPAEQPAARQLAEVLLSAGIERVVLASCGGRQFFCAVVTSGERKKRR